MNGIEGAENTNKELLTTINQESSKPHKHENISIQVRNNITCNPYQVSNKLNDVFLQTSNCRLHKKTGGTASLGPGE